MQDAPADAAAAGPVRGGTPEMAELESCVERAIEGLEAVEAAQGEVSDEVPILLQQQLARVQVTAARVAKPAFDKHVEATLLRFPSASSRHGGDDDEEIDHAAAARTSVYAYLLALTKNTCYVKKSNSERALYAAFAILRRHRNQSCVRPFQAKNLQLLKYGGTMSIVEEFARLGVSISRMGDPVAATAEGAALDAVAVRVCDPTRVPPP